MANNIRDVALRISAQAEGEEQLRALAVELEKLAQEGGEAAPAFAALSQQLKGLSNQQGLIGQFSEIKRKTVEAESAFKAATVATGQAARALRDKQSALQAATAAENAANKTLAEAKQRLEESGTSARAAAAELRPFKQAAADAAKETKAAAAGIREANKAFDESKRAAGKAKADFEGNSRALNDLRKSAAAVGIDTKNLAQAQINASQSTARLTSDFSRLKTEQESAGRAVQNALGVVGVRSAEAIRAELSRVNQAMQTLRNSGQLAGADLQRALKSGEERAAALRRELSGVEKNTGGLLASVRALGPAISAAFVGNEFIKANVELENIERTFRALTGSSEAAAAELAYVRDVADRLGIEAISAAKAYSSLSAATKGTGVEGESTRRVFEAVARSMSVAGKSSADTEGALQALAQMASKGQVSMEELRQQLGERLPGAMRATADGLGITVAELNALVESGKLTADEVFPALAKGLNDLYGASSQAGQATETLTQEWSHFKNTISEAFKSIGDAGVIRALKAALEGLGAVVVVTETMFVTLGKTIGTFFAAIANGDVGLRGFNDRAKQAFADIENEARDKLVKAARHNEVLAATLDENGKKALEAAKANEAAAAEAEKGGNAAGKASGNWTRLNVAFADLEKNTAAAVKQAEANADARKAETAASLALTQAFGTEAQQRKASSDAAQTNAAALDELAARKKELFAITQANLTQLQQEVTANGGATDAQKKVIAELTKTAEARRADAEKASAQASASRIAAQQAQIEAQTHADNSGRLQELKTAYEQATAALEQMRLAKAAGKATTEQLTLAETEAAKAAILYRDALADQAAAIQATNSVKQAEISLAGAGIRLAIEQQRSILESARARGDEGAAVQSLIEIKRLEIKLAQLTAQAKKAEADAALLIAQAKRAELQASGQLTAAKEAEIKAQELAAKAKQVEAQIAGEVAKRMEELTEQTILSGQVAREAAGGYDKLASSLGSVADSAARAADSVDSASTAAASGGASAGSSAGVEINGDAYFRQKILEQDLDTETAKAALDKINLIYAQEVAKAKKGGFLDTNDYLNKMKYAEKQAIEKATREAQAERQQAQNAQRDSGASPAQVTRFELSFGGKTSRVNVAGPEDAAALTSLFRQLEDSSQRAF